eukprot:702346_1
MPLNVSVIGSGNWGTAVARIAGNNVKRFPELFSQNVWMNVYPEQFEGRDLAELINEKHENPKYLPGIDLPENLVANGDVEQCVKDADILVFVVPHQFLPGVCKGLKQYVKPGARAISFIKGVFCDGKGGIELVTEFIRRDLQIPACAISGATVADQVGQEKFSEVTLGFDPSEIPVAEAVQLQRLFDTPYFKVGAVAQVAGVEVFGALKNMLAIGAGFIDGLDMGSNTKAAVMRIGMGEMRKFARQFYQVESETFWQSCGIADVITTCFGGRNRKCAEAFARGEGSWKDIEKRLLNGQLLQGTLTTLEIHDILEHRGLVDEYPLFREIHKISFEGAAPKTIIDFLMHDELEPILMFDMELRAKMVQVRDQKILSNL